jgi:hypothetical protein
VSTDPVGAASEESKIAQPAGGDAQGQPSEEDRLRAAYEAELSRITSADMILQAAVSLLNLGGRRLGLVPGAEGERDLEQVRDAVDGVRALLGILERSAPAQELRPLRDALSQLQMAYAREAQAGAGPSTQQERGAEKKNEPAAPGKPDAPATPGKPGAPLAGDKSDTPAADGKPGAGPAESSGRLWVPGR